MFNIVEIVGNITGFLKNLNLSKKDVIIIFCILGIATTSSSASYYRSKSNRLKASLTVAEDALRIEKDKPKLEDNLDWIEKLKKDNKELDEELQALWKAYDVLDSEDAKPKDYTERLKDVKSAKDVCKEFSDLGYPICDDIVIDCGR